MNKLINLFDLLESENIEAEEMAERCEVSLEFFLKRLDFLSKKKDFLELCNGSNVIIIIIIRVLLTRYEKNAPRQD